MTNNSSDHNKMRDTQSHIKADSDRAYSFFAFFTLSLIVGAGYWITSFIMRPDDPLSTIIYYRYGDMDYFSSIFRVLDAGYGDFTIFEHQGKGVFTFPFMAQFPYQVMNFLFGKVGFVIADILLSGIRFYIIFLIVSFFTSKHSAIWAFIIFLLCSSQTASFMSQWVDIPDLWNFRIARNYVNSVYLFFSFYMLVKVVNQIDRDKITWSEFALLGLSLSLMLQASIHDAMILCSGAFIIFTFHTYQKLKIDMSWIVLGLVFLLCSSFFIFQQIAGSKEMHSLWGIYPHIRVEGIIVLANVPRSAIGYGFISFVIATFYRYLYVNNIGKIAHPDRKHSLFFTLGILFIVLLFFPHIFSAISRLGVQDHHFVYTYRIIEAIFQVSLILFFTDIVIIFLAKFSKKENNIQQKYDKAGAWLITVLLLTSIALTTYTHAKMHIERNNTTVQARVWHKDIGKHGGGWKKIQNYREDFNDLVRWLNKRESVQQEVLGSLDFQLGQWWVAFRDGYVYLPDTFASISKQSEIESRLFSFLKMHNISTSTFEKLLTSDYFIKRFHSLFKYQANALYTYASTLNEYPPEVLDRIYRSPFISMLHIPISEKKRILDAYKKHQVESFRLDIIVSVKETPYYFQPSPEYNYCRSYQNRTFDIFEPCSKLN
ncbi:MAG: hypothetical protein HQL68_07185 [Magnetococcales bacterium]|nr:hypothetical protein [Magnetococcales bacterium]